MGRPKKIEPNAVATTDKPDITPVTQNPVASIDSPHIPGPAANFLQVEGQIKSAEENQPINWSKFEHAATTSSVTVDTRPLRNNRGLYPHVEYVYTPEGMVDWKSMLFKKPEYLYILTDKKKEVEEQYGKKINELNPLEVDEKYLCITLPGIRYLANLRGYTRIKNKVDAVTYDPAYQVAVACTATCEITWIGNFESDFRAVKTSDTAGANLRNCFGFAQKYVESIAANRAFVRAVRGYLGISIVAKDEVGPQEQNPLASLVPVINPNKAESAEPAKLQPFELLESKVSKLGLSFDQFKLNVSRKYRSSVKSNPDDWTSYESIPRPDIFELTSIVADRLKEKDEKAIK